MTKYTIYRYHQDTHWVPADFLPDILTNSNSMICWSLQTWMIRRYISPVISKIKCTAKIGWLVISLTSTAVWLVGAVRVPDDDIVLSSPVHFVCPW